MIVDFDKFATLYMELIRADVKSSTFSKYETIVYKRILPRFSGLDIRDIKVSDIRLWLASYGNISPKTYRDYLGVLSGIFQVAYYDEVIDKNPCSRIRLPKLNKREVEPFTVDEVKRILAAVDNKKFKMYLQIAFYTGMRSGEIIALRVSDIDLEHRRISVTRSRGRFGETSPKTFNGIRVVPILQELYEPLREYLQDHRHEYLFVTRFGTPYKHNETFYQKMWIPLLERLGLPYRRLYNTRHTFATMMLSRNYATPHKIAQILGHRDSQMLHQVYAKYIKSDDFGFDLDIALY